MKEQLLLLYYRWSLIYQEWVNGFTDLSDDDFNNLLKNYEIYKINGGKRINKYLEKRLKIRKKITNTLSIAHCVLFDEVDDLG